MRSVFEGCLKDSHWSPFSGSAHLAAGAEQTQTQPSVLYGAVASDPILSTTFPIHPGRIGWQWDGDRQAVRFHLTVILYNLPDGWGMDPHPSVFSGQDWIWCQWGSAIRRSIESNRWSNWVCLKSWQADPINLSVWKGPKTTPSP